MMYSSRNNKLHVCLSRTSKFRIRVKLWSVANAIENNFIWWIMKLNQWSEVAERVGKVGTKHFLSVCLYVCVCVCVKFWANPQNLAAWGEVSRSCYQLTGKLRTLGRQRELEVPELTRQATTFNPGTWLVLARNRLLLHHKRAPGASANG